MSVLRARGLTAVPPARRRASTRANPSGLTNRQLDVARLVARGLTNAELARDLYISPKTVDHHVSAVLGRLGLAHPTRDRAACRRARPGLTCRRMPSLHQPGPHGRRARRAMASTPDGRVGSSAQSPWRLGKWALTRRRGRSAGWSGRVMVEYSFPCVGKGHMGGWVWVSAQSVVARPASMAAMMRGRMSWAVDDGVDRADETARWMLCTASNSEAT